MKRRLFMVLMAGLALALALVPGSAVAKVGGKFAVALMLPGSLNDGSWNAVAYKAGRQLEATLGIKVTIQEQIKDSDAERALRGYAAQGYDLIIGHTFNWLDQLYKVSKLYPKTAFLESTGYKTRKNFGWADDPMYEGYYLCGIIAGMLTKTNKVGGVGGFEIPTTTAAIEAFRLGAQSVNSKVKLLATYAGSWTDAQKGREAAIAQIEAGADFVMGAGNGLTIGVIRGVAEKGARTFGYVGNMSNVAPKVVMTSVIWDLYSLFKEVTLQVMNGTFKGQRFSLGMARGGVLLAPYGPDVPDNVKRKVDEVRRKIISGEFKVPFVSKPTVGGKKK